MIDCGQNIDAICNKFCYFLLLQIGFSKDDYRNMMSSKGVGALNDVITKRITLNVVKEFYVNFEANKLMMTTHFTYC